MVLFSLSGSLLGHSCLGRNSAEVEVINDSTVLVSYIFIQLLERHVSVKPFSVSLFSLSACLYLFLSLFDLHENVCVHNEVNKLQKNCNTGGGFLKKLLSVVHLSLKVGMTVTSMQLCSFTSVLMTMTGNKR